MRECDNCSSNNVNLIVKFHSRRPYVWSCFDCGASVGCHANTYEPLGKMALAEVRYMRILAHRSFDDIWLSGLMSRERAKRWMAEQLELNEEFHISNCSYGELVSVIRISQEYLTKKIKSDAQLERMKEVNYERKTRELRRTSKLNSVFRRRRKRKS